MKRIFWTLGLLTSSNLGKNKSYQLDSLADDDDVVYVEKAAFNKDFTEVPVNKKARNYEKKYYKLKQKNKHKKNNKNKKKKELDKKQFNTGIRRFLAAGVLAGSIFFFYTWMQYKKSHEEALAQEQAKKRLEELAAEVGEKGFATDEKSLKDLYLAKENNGFSGHKVIEGQDYGLVIGSGGRLSAFEYKASRDFEFLQNSDFNDPASYGFSALFTYIKGQNNFVLPSEDPPSTDSPQAVSDSLKIDKEYQAKLKNFITDFVPVKLRNSYSDPLVIPYFKTDTYKGDFSLKKQDGNIFIPKVIFNFDPETNGKTLSMVFKFDNQDKFITFDLTEIS